MQLEIHWPEASNEHRWYGTTNITDNTLNEDVVDFLDDVVRLSRSYDVIIDNGKVTFVDKE